MAPINGIMSATMLSVMNGRCCVWPLTAGLVVFCIRRYSSTTLFSFVIDPALEYANITCKGDYKPLLAWQVGLCAYLLTNSCCKAACSAQC